MSYRAPRIFLPNWFMKCVRPGKPIAENEAVFHVPMKMTKFDIRNYLTKIYGINVQRVNTLIQVGRWRRDLEGRRVQQRDFKKAYVVMDKPFTFPELFKVEEKEADDKRAKLDLNAKEEDEDDDMADEDDDERGRRYRGRKRRQRNTQD